ncbi:MAG TPA: lytic transglycosylase domain-containing protein [Anaerolineaceae bacterium]|nr:lytic transglycosylase domain-containing protein [Anaerolineaceae bacterium]HPN52559.1 lytic transglycosylase domain-containing protein [Anaerolineaceae bacterium]
MIDTNYFNMEIQLVLMQLMQKMSGTELSGLLDSAQNTGASTLKSSADATVTGSFAEIIREKAAKYNVDPALVQAVIKAESNFNPDVVSSAGAQGLMQLMPGTARSLGVTNAFDPEQNIEGGVKFLRQLLDRFGGNTTLAVAAYNAGPGAVSKYDGIPPYQETQTYVRRVLGYYQSAMNGRA